MILYFSLLPTDLLPSLLLFFDSKELLATLPELKKLLSFDRLFNSDVFWRKLWRRDISSFIGVPVNPYEKYREIFNTLSKFKYKDDKIDYLAEMDMIFYCCPYYLFNMIMIEQWHIRPEMDI